MRLVRLKEVMACTGLGRSSIYKFMAEGHFPKSISLGERAVAWGFSEVEEWVATKIEDRNKVLEKLVESAQVIKVSEIDVIKFIHDKFHQLSVSDAITWLLQIYKQVK
ncbi:MAG: prophage regulatory protein [Cocleimonas sp.]|jgi:prophage regulatory protein